MRSKASAQYQSEVSKLPRPIYNIDPFPDLASDLSDNACLEQIKFWIRNCERVHPYCPKEINAALPGQVVDANSLRLYESNGETEKYLALSHCWGTNVNIKTQHLNIAQRYRGLP